MCCPDPRLFIPFLVDLCDITQTIVKWEDKEIVEAVLPTVPRNSRQKRFDTIIQIDRLKMSTCAYTLQTQK